MPSNLAINCSEQPMATMDIKVLLASLILKLVFKIGSMLTLQHDLPKPLVHFHHNFIVPLCHEESLKLPHYMLYWSWWIWQPQFCCIHWFVSWPQIKITYFQLSSWKAAGLSWICSPEMVHCLHTKYNHRLLCTQQALLNEGDCLWFPWCIPKWHSLPTPGALPG